MHSKISQSAGVVTGICIAALTALLIRQAFFAGNDELSGTYADCSGCIGTQYAVNVERIIIDPEISAGWELEWVTPLFAGDSIITAIDVGQAAVHTYNFHTGEAIQSGRRGAGPGEFQRIGGLVRGGGDSITVSDRVNNHILTFFHGKVAVYRKLPETLPHSIEKLAGVASGNIPVFLNADWNDLAVGRHGVVTASVHAVTDSGNTGDAGDSAVLLAQLSSTRYQSVGAAPQGRTAVPRPVPVRLSGRAMAAVAYSMVLLASAPGDFLQLRTVRGRLIAVTPVRISRRPVTAAMQRMLRARELDDLAARTERPLNEREARLLIEQAPFADSLPLIDRIIASPSDSLFWIVEFIAPGDTGWRAHAVSLTGEVVAGVASHFAGEPLDFRGNRVLIRTLDSQGMYQLEVREFEVVR